MARHRADEHARRRQKKSITGQRSPILTMLGMLVKNPKDHHPVTLQAIGRSIRVRGDNQLTAVGHWRRFPCIRKTLQHLQAVEDVEDGCLPQYRAD